VQGDTSEAYTQYMSNTEYAREGTSEFNLCRTTGGVTVNVSLKKTGFER